MPQTYQVLKCYKCSIFQVSLAKKSNKWECKVCGEKQSIKRHYGIGTAPECRGHVQKLNELQGNKHESVTKLKEFDSDDDEFECIQKRVEPCVSKRKSKWSAFINENEGNSDIDKQKDIVGLDNSVQVCKKQKSEQCKTDDCSKEERTQSNIFGKSIQKEHHIQESRIQSNKWSAFVCDNDKPINTKNIPVQVPKAEECEVYTSNVDEYIKPIFNHMKSNEKNNLTKLCNKKSNKWSGYVSDNGNTNISFNASQTNRGGNKEMTHENRELCVNKFLETPKESTVTEYSKILFAKNTMKCDDNKNNVKKEIRGLFSISDDKDLDSILDF